MRFAARLSLPVLLALAGGLLGCGSTSLPGDDAGGTADLSSPGIGDQGAGPGDLPGPVDGGPSIEDFALPGDDAAQGGDSATPRDLAVVPDLARGGDLAGGGVHRYGPGQMPFPTQRDPMPDPGQGEKNIEKDPNGFIGIVATKANFDFLWLAGDEDWNQGTVSKIDSKKVREVARYFSVTCFSNPEGSRLACDGKSGCCTADDYARFQNRKSGKPEGPRQAVQVTANRPSRTAVDFNGDVWVANRAFMGQSSVSKIANDIADCLDRNGTKGVQTSSDVNGDGVIDTDCNRNNLPDDLADVQKKACVNGKAQEFYGLDDECLLFTTNTNTFMQIGRPIALGKGREDGSPSDAWAGTYSDGKFFRVDGAKGQLITEAQMPPGSRPYGAAIDASGLLWATNLGGGLHYLDTKNPQQRNQARDPAGFSLGGYGITLDRDQNVWVAGGADVFRYTPDRSKDFLTVGKGYWTRVANVGNANGATGSGRGIAVDSRTDKLFFGWVARDGGYVVRFNASSITPPQGIDKSVDGAAYPAIRIAGSGTIGCGVDAEQNVWGISRSGSVATRVKVDAAGTATKPDLMGGMDNQGCPSGAGDRCTLPLNGTMSDPRPYTYSDFTGFGLRNFTLPKGSWDYVLKSSCPPGTTSQWTKIVWLGDTPPATKITVRARSGNTPRPDNTWGPFTGEYLASPADLAAKPGPVMPNPAAYLQVEFTLSTLDQTVSPKLKNVELQFVCK